MCLHCPICLDRLCASPCFSIECGHVFHQQCLTDIINSASNIARLCPCCRKDLTGIRKIFVNAEICSNGIDHERMRQRLIEYEKKFAEHDAMQVKYAQMCNAYSQLEQRCKEKELEWRKRFTELEKENQATHTKPRLPLKTTNAYVDALKSINEQNAQTSELKKKVSQLEQQLRESLEKSRREQVKLREKLEREIRKQLEITIREEMKLELQQKYEAQPRRKLPFRECRKVMNYKE